MKKNIFISPHLDDVVLSCGEYLKKLSILGENITVVSVFAGAPKPEFFSEMAKNYHKRCNLGEDAVSARRCEDKKAMEFYCANYRHLNLYEALYRSDREGNSKYSNPKSLFSRDISEELNTISEIKENISDEIEINEGDRIFLPLSLGDHIDHVIVSKALCELLIDDFENIETYYYEDIPYSYNLLGEKWNLEFVTSLKAIAIDISEIEWQAKIKGINFYKSQIRSLWKDNKEKLEQLNKLSYYLKNSSRKIRFWKYVKVRV